RVPLLVAVCIGAKAGRGRESRHVRSLVARWPAAGDGESGWDGAGVGGGQRSGVARTESASELALDRGLVAGWPAASNGEMGWNGEGMGCSSWPGVAFPQRAYGSHPVLILVARWAAVGDGEF